MRIEIVIAIIGAVVGITTSIVTAGATTDARTGQIDTKVQVLEERQNNQYKEVKDSLDRIEKKLDAIPVKK